MNDMQTMGGAWTPTEVMSQVTAIQQLMSQGMKDGEHFGKIPGCGDKPALLKAGAEKLGLMFRLASKFTVETIDMPNSHREYRVKAELYHINSQAFWGAGVGSCSTMESKFRYRSGAGESTGVPVPKAYWDIRRVKPKEAQELLGGPKYTTKKGDDGLWWIHEKVDKQENPDIADTYNTVLKMAKKRAYVDAMLSATAASDIFTQDIEEIMDKAPVEAKTVEAKAAPTAETITHEEQLELVSKVKQNNITQDDFKGYLKETFGIAGWKNILKADYNKVMEWVIRNEKTPF